MWLNVSTTTPKYVIKNGNPDNYHVVVQSNDVVSRIYSTVDPVYTITSINNSFYSTGNRVYFTMTYNHTNDQVSIFKNASLIST
jgi:hypothetical protein